MSNITPEEFYNEVLKLLSYTGKTSEHFRNRLSSALKEYQKLVKNLRIDGNPVDASIIDDIDYVIQKLKTIVESSMKGLQSTAYFQLQNLFQDEKREPNKIDLSKVLTTISENHNFYRIRQMGYVFEVKRSELFHIPLDKRGIVKTQRYSTPGYPCLYLGESIYGCWEEMRRPPMHTCAVARITNTEESVFLNLTIPPKDEIVQNHYLLLIPLMISCMIRVADDSATYKPEYIIPQLLIEWVLKQRRYKKPSDDLIHGVMYTSTHRGRDFDFPSEKCINYAVPAFSVDMNTIFCKKLCKFYHITEPTTNELEKLKEQYGIGWETIGITEEEKKLENYNSSDFGQLEERLKDESKFPTAELSPKR